MRDQRENKETRGILADVPRVVIPLGDAVAHDRAGDALELSGFFSVRGIVLPPAGDVISVSPASGAVKHGHASGGV